MQRPAGHEEQFPLVTIQPIQPIANEEEQKYILPLDGKLITNEDPMLIGKNFQQLTNMRYVPGHPESILGMTRITSSPIDATYFKVREAFQFTKATTTENHLLVQSYNSALTASKIFDNITAVPGNGNFSATALWTDSVGASVGKFSPATNDQIAYCNGVDSLIWGGNEMMIGAFLTSTAAIPANGVVVNPIDFSIGMQNSKTDIANLAYIGSLSSNNYFLVGSPRPLQGITAYVHTANTSTSNLTVKIFNGSSWNSLTVTDNTIVGVKSLCKTGTVTWSSTVSTSQPTFINGYYLYWYQFHLSAGSAVLSQVNVNAPMQPIVNMWDGTYRTAVEVWSYSTATWYNITTKLLRQDYNSADPTTYTYTGNDTVLYFGFNERITGTFFLLPDESYQNSNSSTLTVYYWDSVAWVSVGTIVDGTSVGGKTMNISGVISWNAVAANLDFATTVQDQNSFHYYKFVFSSAPSETRIDYVGGIVPITTVSNYSFPLLAGDRLMLGCNTAGEKNTLLISAANQAQVFNGNDSYLIYFGDGTALTCGTSIFAQYASNIYNMALIFKNKESWSLVWQQGTTGMQFTRYCISPNIGCPAPKTLKTVSAAFGNNINEVKVIGIWRAEDGVYISNGQSPLRVSHDIDNIFDQSKTLHVNPEMVASEYSFVDEHKLEYHWCWASGSNTTLDKEYVLDLNVWKWFEIDRTTGLKLQCGVDVIDSYGNFYTYGFIDTGYMEILEQGTTFDGQPITSTIVFGEQIFVEKDTFEETSLTRFNLKMIPKTSNVTLLHTMDGVAAGSSFTIFQSGSNRYVNSFTDIFSTPGIFHTISLVTTSSADTKGFEPIYAALLFKRERTKIS